jgi:hypothetical protein
MRSNFHFSFRGGPSLCATLLLGLALLVSLFLMRVEGIFGFVSLTLLRSCASFCPFHSLTSSRSTSSPHHLSLTEDPLPSSPTPLLGQLPITANQSDPYVQANTYFRDSYQQTKLKIIPQVKILHEGDYFVLSLPNGSRYTEPIVQNIYHNLKMISHLPVTVYILLLANHTHSLLIDQPTINNLTEFQQMLQTVKITTERFPESGQYERQWRLYRQTNDFITQVLLQRSCSFESLSAFAWNTSIDINLNLDDAAENSINLIHSAVMNWKTNILSADQWAELYVATLGRYCRPSPSDLS